MQDQDIISEDERHEAATEAPVGESKSEVEVERRNVPLAHFPSGADGTEPAPKKRGEVEKLNRTLFGILRNAVIIATDAMHDYVEEGITEEDGNVRMLAACKEIRKLVDFYKPSDKPLDPSAPELVNPSRLDDIGIQMDKTTVVDDDGVVCKIRRAGVLMMGIGRPAQLWEVDATKHPTYCRVMVYCDHRPIFDGKAFGRNLHRADLLGLAVMIRFIQAQRKHQRKNRKAAVKKLIKEELA